MKFQAWNLLPYRIFCGTYAEVSNFAAGGPVSSGPLVLPLMIEILAPLTGGHGKSKIKYTNLIVKMDRLPDPPLLLLGAVPATW